MSQNPLAYTGINPYVNPSFLTWQRAPQSSDIYPPGTRVMNASVTPKLIYQTSGSGVWELMDSGSLVLPLSVPNGGTGRDTLTENYILAGNGEDPIQMIDSSSTGFVLTSNGASPPTFQAPSALLFPVTYVDSSASPYSASESDVYIACDSTGGALSIILPEEPDTGKIYIIKDSSGTAGTNKITITKDGGGDIDGESSYEMDAAYESTNFIYLGLVDRYEVY